MTVGQASFTIVNNGGSMTQPQPYTVTNSQGTTVASGTIQLAAGQSTSITVASTSSPVTLTSGSLSTSASTNCGEPQTTPTPTATEICGQDQTTDDGFPVIDMSLCGPDTGEVEAPPWTPIDVGGAVCPDWLVYHTNMTGDWELFRLGELPDGVQADPNLSRGVGERIFDVMPASSPDRKWIAFASNRDGNWEIYLSAVEEDMIRRVTFNTSAIDVDPVWSPIGDNIIYESSRDGNWELYMFNVGTGVETRLTDNPASDVNAAWAPDGSKFLFQSDREGFWQIYEMDINTLQVTRLSDGVGDDHEPQFSEDGQVIIFTSYRDGNNSVLYRMDADGGNVTRISDPAGVAANAALSPDGKLLGYQSNLDGDNDIYVYEMATGQTRLLTDNTIEDYAPTWWCDEPTIVFTSDVTGDSNLFDTSALPMDGAPILVDEQANQLTTAIESDQYPENAPPEEDASRQGNFPSAVKNK
ncbi:MAG: DPP IV N-terminal domain-containing protein [Anaerolineae bacterium]